MIRWEGPAITEGPQRSGKGGRGRTDSGFEPRLHHYLPGCFLSSLSCVRICKMGTTTSLRYQAAVQKGCPASTYQWALRSVIPKVEPWAFW